VSVAIWRVEIQRIITGRVRRAAASGSTRGQSADRRRRRGRQWLESTAPYPRLHRGTAHLPPASDADARSTSSHRSSRHCRRRTELQQTFSSH